MHDDKPYMYDDMTSRNDDMTDRNDDMTEYVRLINHICTKITLVYRKKNFEIDN